MSLNAVQIAGRFTAAPVVRIANSGKSVCNFTIAVDRDRKNAEGQWETDFIPCVAFGSAAEFIEKYFNKGSMAIVVGRLQLRDWTDKDGSSHRTAEILVSNVYFAGDSKREADSGSRQATHRAPSRDSFENARKPEFTEISPDTEDPGLPF